MCTFTVKVLHSLPQYRMFSLHQHHKIYSETGFDWVICDHVVLLRVIGNGELYIQKQSHRVVLQTSWSQSSYLLFIFIFLLHFSKISNKTQMKNAFSVTFMALACKFTTTTTNKSNLYNNFSEISLIFSYQIFFSTNLGQCFCVCLFTRK